MVLQKDAKAHLIEETGLGSSLGQPLYCYAALPGFYNCRDYTRDQISWETNPVYCSHIPRLDPSAAAVLSRSRYEYAASSHLRKTIIRRRLNSACSRYDRKLWDYPYCYCSDRRGTRYNGTSYLVLRFLAHSSSKYSSGLRFSTPLRPPFKPTFCQFLFSVWMLQLAFLVGRMLAADPSTRRLPLVLANGRYSTV
jgi:hypothetical protein